MALILKSQKEEYLKYEVKLPKKCVLSYNGIQFVDKQESMFVLNPKKLFNSYVGHLKGFSVDIRIRNLFDRYLREIGKSLLDFVALSLCKFFDADDLKSDISFLDISSYYTDEDDLRLGTYGISIELCDDSNDVINCVESCLAWMDSILDELRHNGYCDWHFKHLVTKRNNKFNVAPHLVIYPFMNGFKRLPEVVEKDSQYEKYCKHDRVELLSSFIRTTKFEIIDQFVETYRTFRYDLNAYEDLGDG